MENANHGVTFVVVLNRSLAPVEDQEMHVADLDFFFPIFERIANSGIEVGGSQPKVILDFTPTSMYEIDLAGPVLPLDGLKFKRMIDELLSSGALVNPLTQQVYGRRMENFPTINQAWRIDVHPAIPGQFDTSLVAPFIAHLPDNRPLVFVVGDTTSLLMESVERQQLIVPHVQLTECITIVCEEIHRKFCQTNALSSSSSSCDLQSSSGSCDAPSSSGSCDVPSSSGSSDAPSSSGSCDAP